MRVKELIKVLEGCNENSEVFFEETNMSEGVGSITMVNSVFEVGIRENDAQPWNVVRVVLSNDN